MSTLPYAIDIQCLLDSPIYSQHIDPPTISQGATKKSFQVVRRAGVPLNKAWIRIIIVFSSVIVLSLLATLVGCIAASRHGKRRKILKADEPTSINTPTPNELHISHASSSSHSSDTDVEMLAQLDTIMASHAFHGREWDIYKSEMREKAKRHAKGFVHTSQGINSPIDVRHLRGKMRALSRSLLHSITRSEAIQDPLPDLAALDEILEDLKKAENTANTAHGTAKPLEITNTTTVESDSKSKDLPQRSALSG